MNQALYQLTHDERRATQFDVNNLQSHGVLLCLREEDLVITHVTQNAAQLLGISATELIDQPLDRLIAERDLETLRMVLREDTQLDQNAFFMRVTESVLPFEFDVILHRDEQKILLEIEPYHSPTALVEANWLRKTERVLDKMRTAPDLNVLLQELVDCIAEKVGMQRVMAYIFDRDWNGHVQVERCSKELKSCLGLYFPPYDLAPSIRDFYLLGLSRYIHNVDYIATRLYPELPSTQRQIDLCNITLRGFSPNGLSFLRYIGVRSALMLPLIVNHQLWGLVVCHGYQVNMVPYSLRRLCGMLVQNAGLLIADHLRTEERQVEQRLQDARRHLFNMISEQRGQLDPLFEQASSTPQSHQVENLADQFIHCLPADSIVYWNDRHIFSMLGSSGQVDKLNIADARQLINWLQHTEPVTEDFIATDQLEKLIPGWHTSDRASGMIAIPLAGGWKSGLLWLRAEARFEMVWASNPMRPLSHIEIVQEGRTFAIWKEKITGRCKPWSEAELHAAQLLAGLRSHIALKLTEEQLRVNENRYRRLAAQTTDWYWEQDAEHRLLYTTNELWKRYGFNPNVVVGRRRWEIGGVQFDAERWADHIACMDRHEPFRDFEYEIVLPNGESRWASMSGEPIFDQQNHFIGYLGTGIDITDRKRAELAIAESEARFRLLADNAPVLIWLADELGARTYLNRTWLEFTGASLNSQLGHGWLNHVYPDDLARVEQTIHRVVEARERTQIEYRLRYHDGSYRWVQSTAIPRLANEGHFLGFIGSVMDIHARKQLEMELLSFNQHLEERVEQRTGELESFAYTISHDLRTPLRSIDGFAALLAEECGTTLTIGAQRYLERIRSGAQQMGELIDALLGFSRYSLRPLERSHVDMAMLIEEVVREIVPAERRVQIHIKSTGDFLINSCDGDPTLLKQVWVNLISNAIKFTRTTDAPQIIIGQNENVYFVQDNGVGFDMAYSNKLFGVFNRLHTEAEFEGTGAGLAIVRRIIERHGGKIWAEAQQAGPQRGATFYFTIPAAPATNILAPQLPE